MAEFKVLKNIKNQGFARVYLPTQSIVDEVMKGFLDFLADQLEYRQLWTFDLGDETETGYLPRDKPVNKMTGYAYDHKDVFHFTPDLFSRLNGREVTFQKYKEWLSALHNLYHKILEVGKSIAHELAGAYSELNLDIDDRVEEMTRQKKTRAPAIALSYEGTRRWSYWTRPQG